MPEKIPHYDVIVVGAGIAGIGAAYHLQSKCPGKKITVLEARDRIGGTWDLFKYPGIRSDSDMYTLGFSFNPWKEPQAIADGPAILKYIKETASKFGIDQKIQFNHKVADASWSDKEERWTLKISSHKNVKHEVLTCNFLFMCSGYYDYENGYTPEFKGIETFKGQIIHPQKWDPKTNYSNKKVVIIGSGATAITLVPEMAKKAGKVTMLQRSPSYVISVPGEDPVVPLVKKFLPAEASYELIRWKNIMLMLGFYKAARQWPNAIRRLIATGVKQQLGSEYDMKHFNPTYKPWDQRVCVVPDADLFKAIKNGKAEIVTDTIKRFTPTGILLDSGRELDADIIVTATGLRVQLLGGMTMHINNKLVELGKIHVYRGVMMSDIPNFAITVGYTNASWTLKCDLSCHFVTKLLNYMDRKNHTVCIPRFDPSKYQSEPLLDFNSGYVQRAANHTPKQGSEAPWKVHQNYLRDTLSLKMTDMNDKVLEYR